MSFQEEKWKREARIKSKRWHRVKRRASDLSKERELERLRVSDPDAFRERVDRVERERVEERASLRHRSEASKFARRQKLFAKFDTHARDAMEQMHQIGTTSLMLSDEYRSCSVLHFSFGSIAHVK